MYRQMTHRRGAHMKFFFVDSFILKLNFCQSQVFC